LKNPGWTDPQIEAATLMQLSHERRMKTDGAYAESVAREQRKIDEEWANRPSAWELHLAQYDQELRDRFLLGFKIYLRMWQTITIAAFPPAAVAWSAFHAFCGDENAASGALKEGVVSKGLHVATPAVFKVLGKLFGRSAKVAEETAAVTSKELSAGRAGTNLAAPQGAPLLGGSAQRQAYLQALQAEGRQNYQFIRAAGQQYSERSCVPGVLQQRLGSSPEMARMVALADRQGGYTLQQARNFLANNELVPAGNMRLVDSISMQDLATRAAQANGRTTSVLNVRGTSGPHAVGVQGWTAVDGVPGGAFRIHDPLTGTEYWLSAQSLQQRVTGPNLGSALLID
jgi:hypothetical protein